MLNNSKVFKYAHEMTRKIVNRYGVDYRTQFSVCLKYVRGMCKLSVIVYDYNHTMRGKFEDMQKVCEDRYWNMGKEETELCNKCPNRFHCKRILEVDTGDLLRDYSLDRVVSQFVVNRYIEWKGNDKDIDFYISCFNGDIDKMVRTSRQFNNYYNNVRRGMVVNI